MDSPEYPGFATRAIHAGAPSTRPGGAQGDVVSPIHLSSTFRLDEVPDVSLMDLDPSHGEYLYSRLGNPTRQVLEERIASLTGGTHGFAFGSGTGAVLTTVLASAQAGDAIVAFDDLYGGSLKLLDQLAEERLEMDVNLVDARDESKVAAAIDDDTALVLMETPTNPLLHLCDISAIADLTEQHGVPLAVDNTFSSPYFQQPLDLGADIVIHSTTKYLNGHSDGLGGAIATNDDDLAEQIGFLQRVGLGNPMAPFDAYMVLRGMKTLAARMDIHQRNAMGIAEYLHGHEGVRRVRYPGHESHPQYDLASEQMGGFGGVLSFELDGDASHARRFLEALEVFSLGVSLGGVESLIELPASMTHESIDEEVRIDRGITETLIRVSVGIEEFDDLIRDLERGFAAAFGE